MSKPVIAAALMMLTVAGCGGGQGLRTLEGENGGADEFSVLPMKPLETPPNLNALPTPVPGAQNRADPTPKADAVAALGGRPSAMSAGGVPVGDRALVAAASRNGVAQGIRQTLAQEDARFRKTRGAFVGWFGRQDPYFKAYRGQRLDAGAELERLRKLGVETPTAPPQN